MLNFSGFVFLWTQCSSNCALKVCNFAVVELWLIADRRHSLFGHICRVPENTPASQALQLSIEAHTGTPPAADWKRPPGHPRRNWLQQVEEDIGISVGAA